METPKFIAYYRVSTDRQGRSGLGLEAQQQAVCDFLAGRGKLIESFTEIESGRKKDRPQLAAALDTCRRYKAILVIAKLDRLARNVYFISGLMESRVEFVAVDMPQANRLTIHILAAVAEHEREMISQRTKAALRAAKIRGVKLGSSQPKKGAAIRSQMLRYKADRFTANTRPIIDGLQAQGITGYRAISRALNARGIQTANGRQWHPTTVKNLLKRVTGLPPEGGSLPLKLDSPIEGSSSLSIIVTPSGIEPSEVNSLPLPAKAGSPTEVSLW
jgi:DNA invertase Pin-like site-specific DNA recombinase